MDEDREIIKGRIQRILSRHVGRHKAMPAASLFREAFDRPIKNKNNDLRILRKLVVELTEEGAAIASSLSPTSGGYYIPIGEELKDYIDRVRREAIGRLGRVAVLERKTFAEIVGQLPLGLEGDAREATG